MRTRTVSAPAPHQLHRRSTLGEIWILKIRFLARPRTAFPDNSHGNVARVPRRLCPTKTMWEKRLNSAESVKLPDRQNIDTGTRFCGSNKCPNVSQMSCPRPPEFQASLRCACHEGNRFPTRFRSPNLSECAVDLRGRAVTRSKSFRGSAHISGRADCDVGPKLRCLQWQ